jgi:hypothetical protein
MVVHLPLFMLNMPANFMMMNSILINVAMLDVFGHEKVCSFCNLSEYFKFNSAKVE